jgi:hypothetical protein
MAGLQVNPSAWLAYSFDIPANRGGPYDRDL